MRPVLIVLAIVVVLFIAALATGFINLSGQSGSLPKVAVEGGKLPSVDANVGKIVAGTKSTTVDVPTVGTKKENIDVPVVGIQKAK